MVAGTLPRIHALAVASLIALVAIGCGARSLGALAETEGVPAAGIVRLSDSVAVAARVRQGLVELLWFEEQDGIWATQMIGSFAAHEPAAGRLITFGGETGQDWNTFFYGTAPPRASRLVVDRPDNAGGQVVNGVWVVAFRAEDVAPSISWDLVDARGNTLESGSGPFPPTT